TNKNLDNTTRNLGSRVYTLELRDPPHKINEAREEFLTEKDKSHKRRRNDQNPHPPPSESDLSKRRLHDTDAFGSSQPQAPQSLACKKSDTRDAPSSSSKQQFDPYGEQPVEDIQYLILPTYLIQRAPNLPIFQRLSRGQNASIYQVLAENSLLAKTKDMQMFMYWYCQKIGKTELTQADFKGQAYEVVKAFYPDAVHLQFQMEECHKMLTDQVDWANLKGDQVRIDQGNRTGFIDFHLDFGLELLIPEHMWTNEVCTYDISASYGISHWWFNRQKFYIDRHIVDSSRKIIRTHMRILSVVSIKSFSHYGYDYLKEITLRKADYQEYMIAEKDFKSLYPSDFEDLNLLLL
nr:hypothetical protein [Tanacetum cinerariifolium]